MKKKIGNNWLWAGLIILAITVILTLTTMKMLVLTIFGMPMYLNGVGALLGVILTAFGLGKMNIK